MRITENNWMENKYRLLNYKNIRKVEPILKSQKLKEVKRERTSENEIKVSKGFNCVG